MRHLITLTAIAMSFSPAWGWDPIGASVYRPNGIYQYNNPASNGPGAYKYGYGDYSDRYGYRPDAPGNANLNPVFPTQTYGFTTYTPPPVYPVTTYGGYRGNTVAEALMPGVFR